MSDLCVFFIHLIFYHVFFGERCAAILVAEQEQSKPHYTPGIKTANWINPIVTHQNYSRVVVHNKPNVNAQYIITRTQKTQNMYPVYNAHSYGANSRSHENVFETKSHADNYTGEFPKPNRTIFKRKIEYKSLEVYEKCPSGVTGQFVYSSSCNQYLNCWKGRGVLQNCAPGTLFNPITLECDFPEKVKCITGSGEITLPNLRVPKSVPQANCPEGFSGLIPNYTDCTRFISCSNGQPFPMDCPPGTLFDINQNICDHPNKCTCFNGQSGSEIKLQLGQQGYQSIGQIQGEYPGQYHQTFQGLNHGCQNPGDNCGQNTKANNQLEYSSTNTQYGSRHHETNHNPLKNFQQSGTRLYPFNNQNQGLGTLTVSGQSNCNPRYENCIQRTEQSGGISTGYDHSTTHTHTSTTGSRHNQDQIVSYGQSSPDLGYGSSLGPSISQYEVTRQNCNPSLRNCAEGTRQGQNSNRGYGQTIINSHGSGQYCNPSIQNCGQIVGQGGDSTVGRDHKNQGTSTGNSPNKTPGENCNPSIQDCRPNQSSSSRQGPNPSVGQTIFHTSRPGGTGQHSFSSQTFITGYGNGQICNPSLQNCGQNFAQSPTDSNLGGTPHNGISQQDCNYATNNCDQNIPSNEHANHRQTSRKFVCDPRTQLCGQSTQQSGITIHGISQATQDGSQLRACAVQVNCDLSAPNCGQNSGNQNVRFNGHICDPVSQNCEQSQPNIKHSDRNYNIICNINDAECTQAHTIVTRRTTPKCPDGFQGLTKHPSDCKKFLNCANGQTFVQDCAPGTLFNPTLGNCDFPYNVDCEISEGTRIESSTISGEDWNGNYGGNIQEVRPNENIRSTTKKSDNIGPFPKWNNVNIDNQNTITDSSDGEIGLISRPIYPSTTERIRQNKHDIEQTPDKTADYVDIFDPKEQSNLGYLSTTPRNSWPPPFPKNVDYVFDYEDGESVTLDPDDILYAREKKGIGCDDDDFHCSTNVCISQSMVCNGHRDCDNGKDEQLCEEYISRFTVSKDSQLVVLEKQRWVNASYATCAMLCIQNTKFTCRSFNYGKIDRTCFLSDANIGLTGALRKNFLTDYYELNAGTIDCSDHSKYFECFNKKCLMKEQVCDGADDCGDRQDEKNCQSKGFGYSIKLSGSEEEHEGRIEVTAFGKTGYICDDQFGIQDANVVCRELGFELGATEVKGQSYFAKDLKESNTLYMMDEVECFGNETTLLNCGFSGWGIHNCREQEIAGVVCKTPQRKCGKGFWRCDTGDECAPYDFVCDGVNDCTDDSDERSEHCEAPTEIRLANGSRPSEGRLEIKHHGIWGTVCDDDFNEDAAKVVCKYFGFRGKSVVKKDAYFGEGQGPIWLDQVSCFGNETLLEKCTHWNWGEHNCEHDEDVSVICSDEIMEVEVQRNSKLPIRYETGLPKRCGFRKDNQFLENDLIHARVVSGSVARKGDYPWQAALRIKQKDKSAHWCGAVIISSKWVLTAAHCLQGYTKGAYIIVAGEYNTDKDEGTEQQKYIEEFFIHEKFRRGHKMNNDIALIKVKGGGFALNDDVQPICLPDTDTTYDQDLNCTISGFGSVKSGTSVYSHNMMAAWIPMHSNEICKMPHIYGDAFTEGMFCAGFLDGGVDACEGDSGGPLACLDQGYFTLYGITSWGQHCGYANKPGVYVKVAHYRPWIEDIIQRHSQS